MSFFYYHDTEASENLKSRTIIKHLKMKKLKKLKLKKEIISNLNDNEMNFLLGGNYASGLPLTCAICTGNTNKYLCPTRPKLTEDYCLTRNGNFTCECYDHSTPGVTCTIA